VRTASGLDRDFDVGELFGGHESLLPGEAALGKEVVLDREGARGDGRGGSGEMMEKEMGDMWRAIYKVPQLTNLLIEAICKVALT
jgi:hypothetical protein